MHKKTIYDIAKYAGVSPATVSRALSGKGYVSPETKLRIMSASQGYVPRSERSNVTRFNSNTIGIILSHNFQSFYKNSTYSEILNGITQVSSVSGYSLLMINGNLTDDEIIDLYMSSKVDGFLCMGTKTGYDLITKLQNAQIPFVLVGSFIDENTTYSNFAMVDIDDFSAAKEATNYLINLGHRKIAYVSESFDYPSSYHRYLGYKASLKESDIPYNEDYIVNFDNINEEIATNLIKRMLLLPEPPTAIIAFNEITSVAAYIAVTQSGLKIPSDISILGFDDSTFARNASPALTIVSQPFEERGKISTRMLIDGIKGNYIPLKSIIMPSVLIYRESCTVPSK